MVSGLLVFDSKQCVDLNVESLLDKLILLKSSILLASNIAVVKEVEEIMDPAAFSVVRFLVAAILFYSFC